MNSDAGGWWKPRRRHRLGDDVDADAWVARHLADLLGPGEQLLDVGCGSAAVVSAAARAVPGAEVVGVDDDPSRVEAARAHVADVFNASVDLGDPVRLHYDDDSFDVVCARFVVGSVPDVKRVVDEIVRVCRPGGTVLLQEIDVAQRPGDAMTEAGIADALDAVAVRGVVPPAARTLLAYAFTAGLTDAELVTEPSAEASGPLEGVAVLTITGRKRAPPLYGVDHRRARVRV